MRFRKQWFCLLVATVPLCGLAQESQHISVGDSQFTLPLPKGYVDLCDVEPRVAELINPPRGNRLLACYTTPNDLEELRKGAGGLISSYLLATVIEATIERDISPQEFDSYSNRIKASLASLSETIPDSFRKQTDYANAKLSKEFNVDIMTTLDGIVPIGVFDEQRNRFSVAWIMKQTHGANGESIHDQQVQISSSILMKGSVFVLITHGEFSSAADVEKYKAISERWVASFVEGNK